MSRTYLNWCKSLTSNAAFVYLQYFALAEAGGARNQIIFYAIYSNERLPSHFTVVSLAVHGDDDSYKAKASFTTSTRECLKIILGMLAPVAKWKTEEPFSTENSSLYAGQNMPTKSKWSFTYYIIVRKTNTNIGVGVVVC